MCPRTLRVRGAGGEPVARRGVSILVLGIFASGLMAIALLLPIGDPCETHISQGLRVAVRLGASVGPSPPTAVSPECASLSRWKCTEQSVRRAAGAPIHASHSSKYGEQTECGLAGPPAYAMRAPKTSKSPTLRAIIKRISSTQSVVRPSG